MHGSETWPMKVEHEVKMNRTEMSMSVIPMWLSTTNAYSFSPTELTSHMTSSRWPLTDTSTHWICPQPRKWQLTGND